MAAYRHAATGLAVAALAAAPVATARTDHPTRPVLTAATEGRTAVVEYAKRFLGTPYRWGGASPGGFDCSGLTSFVYARFGVRMAHYTGAQLSAYPRVARADLEAGDLVFFDGVGHVGIYVGAGRFIHATNSGDVVRISKLSEDWYRSRYSGAVRPPLPVAVSSTTGPSTRKPSGSRSESISGSIA